MALCCDAGLQCFVGANNSDTNLITNGSEIVAATDVGSGGDATVGLTVSITNNTTLW